MAQTTSYAHKTTSYPPQNYKLRLQNYKLCVQNVQVNYHYHSILTNKSKPIEIIL